MTAAPSAVAGEVDAALRAEGAYAVGRGRVRWRRAALLLAASGAAYGAAMGSFGWKAHGSLYSAAKVPALVALTTVLALPFFYVLNTVLGLREDFTAALRGILACELTLALVLAGLAPVVLVAYSGVPSYPVALLLNGCAFALACAGGQVTLARHYRPLIAANRRHRIGLSAWFLLYGFVAVKLGWILRPFVGDPALPTSFFRPHALDENPYAVLFWTVIGVGWGLWRELAPG